MEALTTRIPKARLGYLPRGLNPGQNPFYVALPYNDCLNHRMTQAGGSTRDPMVESDQSQTWRIRLQRPLGSNLLRQNPKSLLRAVGRLRPLRDRRLAICFR